MSQDKNTERLEAEATMDSAPNGEAAERATAKNLKIDHGHATHAVEGSAEGTRPSRKSTRRGANRVKPDAAQHQKAVENTRSPSHRHGMRGG